MIAPAAPVFDSLVLFSFEASASSISILSTFDIGKREIIQLASLLIFPVLAQQIVNERPIIISSVLNPVSQCNKTTDHRDVIQFLSWPIDKGFRACL